MVAHDGEEAIRALNESGVDAPKLVLLDLKLPKVGGVDVLRWIRQNESSNGVPVVVLTSSDEPRDLLECQRLHANSFIQKPIDFDRFLDVFRRTVEYWITINLAPSRLLTPRH